MKIIYKTKKLEKICTDFNYAQKIYNHNIAKKISIRIDQLSSSNSTEDLILSHVGRCHSLKGNNLHSTYLAPYRLIFTQHQDEIIVAKIIEIIDYH